MAAMAAEMISTGIGRPMLALSSAAVNSRLSPGRKGNSSPVSMKTKPTMTASTHGPEPLSRADGSSSPEAAEACSGARTAVVKADT